MLVAWEHTQQSCSGHIDIGRYFPHQSEYRPIFQVPMEMIFRCGSVFTLFAYSVLIIYTLGVDILSGFKDCWFILNYKDRLSPES